MQRDLPLNYLKIFSWFLLCFGAVGFLAVALNIASYGSKADTLGLLALMISTGGINTYGIRLHNAERVSRNALVYGGWALVLGLVIIGQIWVNNSDINL